jgi:hypothetical protein
MIGMAEPMRIAGEYLAKAAVFEAMADYETDPVDKKRYAALAENYRRLARERQWTLANRAMVRFLRKRKRRQAEDGAPVAN